MSKVTIKLNSAGIKKMLKSDEISQVCDDVGKDVLSNLKEGYEMKSTTGKRRHITTVYADTIYAIRSNNKHNSLLKALGSAKKK